MDKSNDIIGNLCPICEDGLLMAEEPELITGTVECARCGAILPRYPTDDEMGEWLYVE